MEGMWFANVRNAAAKELYSYLLSEAFQTYDAILNEWICHGILNDPYKEFMIQEKPSVSKERLKYDFNDAYWEQRYYLQNDAVPSFLEPYKEKILNTGKYLNVLRECSMDVKIEKDLIHYFGNKPISRLSEVLQVVDGGKYLLFLSLG
jgi:gamma-tubulin complex component 2